jgi:hypothetical protein
MFFGQVHLAILLRPRVWAGGRQPPTGKSAENGRRMARPRTVAPVHKLLLKTPNNPQHVRKIYVTFYCFYSSTRDFFRVAIQLYLFFDMPYQAATQQVQSIGTAERVLPPLRLVRTARRTSYSFQACLNGCKLACSTNYPIRNG